MVLRSGTETYEDNATSRGHKRQSSKTDSAPEPKTKQSKTSDARPSTPDGQKPTLTEKELEFGFDHSQIRDPRATPGRVKRLRFFVDGKGPEGGEGSTQVMDQIKDQVSKDLGVPWHQIDSKQLKKWEDQGFAKVDADEWWLRLNQVERDRFMKMLGGASLRKSL
ncbi:hypothetical protein Forpe1208_v015319 [Fusarium oxysporum f. sp. rapae]|uniref:Uncharacterized protein n=1 Tax=Fusarium oxysporum f. sp. rapae TaxID=485398 RepID=A0A8J5NR47_FUSOX|nr:hypothetical protein Forpe1208_v015319 [Fusarium oxysporum f. sp. rapae]